MAMATERAVTGKQENEKKKIKGFYKKQGRLHVDAQDLSPVLHYIGFEITSISPKCITGSFIVSDRSSRGDGVLNGVSSVIAESLGSLGAFMAAGANKRVAGVELSISHLRSPHTGTPVHVRAVPILIAHTLQVWEIKFLAKNGGAYEDLIAHSKLTATVVAAITKENSVKKVAAAMEEALLISKL